MVRKRILNKADVFRPRYNNSYSTSMKLELDNCTDGLVKAFLRENCYQLGGSFELGDFNRDMNFAEAFFLHPSDIFLHYMKGVQKKEDKSKKENFLIVGLTSLTTDVDSLSSTLLNIIDNHNERNDIRVVKSEGLVYKA